MSGAPGQPRVAWLTLSIPVDPAARVGGLAGNGGVIDGTAYLLEQTDEGTAAVELDSDGTLARLSLVEPNSFSLATYSGAAPMLAWAVDSPTASSVEIARPDARQGTVLLSEQPSITTGWAYGVGRWSADGRRLFVAQNPTGLGGYGVYFGTGVSSLAAVDVASRAVTDLLPRPRDGAILCYDDITTDDRLVVDTCTARVVTVRTLASGGSTTIGMPPGTSSYRILRSARFSPDGARVAFSLNVGDPDHERGAVAVSNGLSGGSRLLVVVPGSGVLVDGWLDAGTLLVESVEETGCTGFCAPSTWTLDVRTGRRTPLTPGSVVALDLRSPTG